MSEWTVVVALGGLLAVLSPILTVMASGNKRWNEVSTNLTKNTMAIERLEQLLQKMEAEIDKRLELHERMIEKHESQLIDHKERLVRLESEKEGRHEG